MPYVSISALYQKQDNKAMPDISKKAFALSSVVLGHGVLLWLLVQQWAHTTPVVVTPPTIQGVVIMAQTKEITPKPVIQPVFKPVAQPTVTPQIKTLPPVKNAPPSEKAITQPEVVETPAKVEPTPQVPVAEPAPSVAASAKPTPEPVEEITQPRSDAAHLNNPAPNYPPMSRRLGEQGRVLLDVYILANGTVGELRIKQSSGFSRLDQAALQTVKTWRYQPARRGQQAIDFWYVQPLSFSLN